MKLKNLCFSVVFAALILVPALGPAQCPKSFVKKNCVPKISPFTSHGQLNSTVMLAGQTAELMLNFSAGLNYRLLICSQEVLGIVEFKLMDKDRNVLFTNTQAKGNPDFWDFNVKTTQQFIVEVSIPVPQKTNSIIPSGCVSVLVGFKEK